jgi:hypothetical protein
MHDSAGRFSAAPGGQRQKLWRDFFLDPSKWWDHRSEEVTERRFGQTSHFNGAISLVGVNLLALSRLLSCHGLKAGRLFFRSFALVGSE